MKPNVLLMVLVGVAFSSMGGRRSAMAAAAFTQETLQRGSVGVPTSTGGSFFRRREVNSRPDILTSVCYSSASLNSNDNSNVVGVAQEEPPSLYRAQGLFSVVKPLDWTSSDVVSYIRGILARDARDRGAQPVSPRSRRNKSRIVRVGHGGTLDPLATGVLVIGVGRGTKELQSYLTGSKRYRAGGEFGFETTTLDMEGNVTATAPYDHITSEGIQNVLPEFTGTIQQVPPIFSAIRKDGKRLYQQAREGVSAEDIDIPPRTVEIYSITLLDCQIPKFDLDIECGGGTYIRSLIRDIGSSLGSVATTTYLERTQQAQFLLESSLPKPEWSADNIYEAIERCNLEREKEEDDMP